jgi:hypothetical protein
MKRIPNCEIGMRSKQLDIKIRIFLFLLCTIGILYISMKLLYRPILYRPNFEAFQTKDNCVYDLAILNGRGVWKCPTEFDAMNLFGDNTVKLNDSDAVCYLTPNPSKPDIKYYTCYQRPPATTFNPVDGNNIPNSYLGDSSPMNIITDIDQVCSDYNALNVSFITALQSTSSYQALISTASHNVNGTTSNLSNISTQYCTNDIVTRLDHNNSRYIFCDTLNRGIDIFTNLPTGPKGLNAISTSITNIINQMSNIYTNKFTTGYAGFQC